MRSIISNATILSRKVVSYINDIVRSVYRVRSNHIKYFGTNFDAATTRQKKGSFVIPENWKDTKLSSISIINGVDMGRLEVYEAFVKNSKQYKTVVRHKHYIKNTKIMGSLVSGTAYVVQSFEKQATSIIKAPVGYDGNLSFVEVLVPVDVMDSEGSGTTQNLKDFYTIIDSLSERVSTKNALLYYSNKVNKGSFTINVAKNSESVIVNTDITGLDDTTFEDISDPYFWVVATFYRRGYE